MNLKNLTKTGGIGLVTFLGFTDELQKIANIAPTGTADVKKTLPTPGSSKLPKAVAKVQPASEPSAPRPDPLSSAKTNPPPPITLGGI